MSFVIAKCSSSHVGINLYPRERFTADVCYDCKYHLGLLHAGISKGFIVHNHWDHCQCCPILCCCFLTYFWILCELYFNTYFIRV